MHQYIKGSVSARLPVPRGLHVGAVIGVGANHVKQIQIKYGVRCLVDAKKREVVVAGPRSAIDGAIDGLQDLFHRLHLERLQYLEQQRERRFQTTGVVTHQHRIYRIAAVVDSTDDSWMFQRRSDADVSGEQFENHLVRLESFHSEDNEIEENDEEARRTQSWIEKFDASFQRSMLQDVETLERIHASASASAIKIKATLGITNYALPEASTACRLYKWDQLQALKLHKDIRRRWQNTCNMRSETVSALMRTLKARLPRDAPYETALTVYVGFVDVSIRDVSVKFLWTDGQWTPVTQRPPIREPNGLYNISLDNETAFRMRVYSRESPSHSIQRRNFWNEMELVQHSSGDPLRTEARLWNDHANGFFIRSVWLRQKTQLDYQGVRFSISFSNAAHTDAIIQCQAVPSECLPTQPAEKFRDLLDKVLAVLSHQDVR